MARNMDIIDDLYRHCISDGNPSSHILENGKFPDGWVDRYLELLGEGNQLWRAEDYWPKKLVAAVHFTSFYLDSRYKAWSAFKKSRNVRTEDALARIRVSSEFFLLDAAVQEFKDNMPK